MLDESEELANCPACGHRVDKEGKTICYRGPNGESMSYVIRLCGLDEEEKLRARDLCT